MTDTGGNADERVILGLDTSNYRTSMAVVTPGERILLNERRLLSVDSGQRGLRQSDAVYLHLKQIKRMEDLVWDALSGKRLEAVAASRAPRGTEDSYMPVFEVGETVGRLLAAAHGVPFVATDHQRGHLRAAQIGTPLNQAAHFLAMHLSGGTTDLLAVHGQNILSLGTGMDLHAGQLVDRIGVAMGLPFPAGPELEKLAVRGQARGLLGCSMEKDDLCCHLSGAETKALGWIREGRMSGEDIAREVYDLLARTAARMLSAGLRKTGLREALVFGGIASSPLFRRMLKERVDKAGRGPEIFFGDPELSGDNAVGVAMIGADACLREGLAARGRTKI